MKIKKEYYNLIKQGIEKQIYEKGKIYFQEVVEYVIETKSYKKNPEISAIWYIYNHSDITEDKNGLQFTCDVLYGYLNDKHIEKALKRIIKELKNGCLIL